MSSYKEGVVTLIIGAIAIWGASLVPPPPDGETWAGVLPMSAAICLALTGGLMVWTSLKSKETKAANSVEAQSIKKSTMRILSLVVLALVYHQAVLKFGYELPTAIAGPATLWLFGVRSKSGLALSIIIFPVVFHILFFKLLGVFPPFGTVLDLMDYLRG